MVLVLLWVVVGSGNLILVGGEQWLVYFGR